MANIAEQFSQTNVLTYANNRQLPQTVGEQLFPSRKIEGLEFDMLKAGSKIPTIASVHAFDSEAEIASREGSRSAAEVALIKRKIGLKERDLIALRNPRTAQEKDYLEREVYNDVDRMIASVNARVELMRMEVLSTGKVTLKENGLDTVIDYEVPKANQVTLDLSNAELDLPTLLAGWMENMDVKPTRILTSTKVRNAIMTHSSMSNIFPKFNLPQAPGSLNQLLQLLELPVIGVYDAHYREEDAKGNLTRKRFLGEDKLVMLSDTAQGETVWGTTPREARISSTVAQAVGRGYIYAEVYEQSIDPVGTYTIAEATALPSFAEADNVVQATVKFAKTTP